MLVVACYKIIYHKGKIFSIVHYNIYFVSREIVDICTSCGDTPEEFEPYYTCNECGLSFTKSNSFKGISNRCPSCNLFGEKVSDKGCTICQDGHTEPSIVYRCDDCESEFETEQESADCCKIS